LISLSFFINIAIARQIFQNKVFFSLPGEVFLIKKRKKSFYEKFAGRQQYIQCEPVIIGHGLIHEFHQNGCCFMM
jgi:hypothetical protein